MAQQHMSLKHFTAQPTCTALLCGATLGQGIGDAREMAECAFQSRQHKNQTCYALSLLLCDVKSGSKQFCCSQLWQNDDPAACRLRCKCFNRQLCPANTHLPFAPTLPSQYLFLKVLIVTVQQNFICMFLLEKNGPSPSRLTRASTKNDFVVIPLH